MIDVYFTKQDPFYGEAILELYKMVKITNITGLDGNEIQIDSQHIPYVNGEYITNMTINGREIIIDVAIEDVARSDDVGYWQHEDKISEITAFFSCGEDLKMCASIPLEYGRASSSLTAPVVYKAFNYTRFDKGIKGQIKLFCPEGGLRSGHHVHVTTQPRPSYVDIGGFAERKIYIGKDPQELYTITTGGDCVTWPVIEFMVHSAYSRHPTYFFIHEYTNGLSLVIRLNYHPEDNFESIVLGLKIDTDPRKRSVMAYDPSHEVSDQDWNDWMSNIDVIDAKFAPFDCKEAKFRTGVLYYDKYDDYKQKFFLPEQYDIDIHFDCLYVGV